MTAGGVCAAVHVSVRDTSWGNEAVKSIQHTACSKRGCVGDLLGPYVTYAAYATNARLRCHISRRIPLLKPFTPGSLLDVEGKRGSFGGTLQIRPMQT